MLKIPDRALRNEPSYRSYQRGDIYYVAYRWDGREYRESARSSDRAVAERLLAQRVRERAGRGPTGAVTFDTLATWYLDDYTRRSRLTTNPVTKDTSTNKGRNGGGVGGHRHLSLVRCGITGWRKREGEARGSRSG